MLAHDMYAIYISYYSNNDVLHINVYYIQFYITFQYIYDMPSGISHGGCGPGAGQGHPPCQFMSI